MKAVDFIKKWEGCKLKAYQDGGGVWTVGYGSTAGVGPHTAISLEEAEKRLYECVIAIQHDINRRVIVSLNECQAAALTSFIYNVGVRAFERSTLLKKLNHKDYLGAADEFLRWDKDNGKVVAGLTRRRNAERELFLSAA